MVAPSPNAAGEFPDDDLPPEATTHRAVASDQQTGPVLVESTGTRRKKETLALTHLQRDDTTQAWLNAQCDMIAGTSCGLVLRCPVNDDNFQPVALWPHTQSEIPPVMLDAASSVFQEQTFAIVSGHDFKDDENQSGMNNCYVASPLLPGDADSPIAVFELPESIRKQQQAIIQLLKWGAVWFALLRNEHPPAAPTNDTLTDVVDMLAANLEQSEFNASVLVVVSELAKRLDCTRVSLGLMQKGAISVCAISNTARIDTRSNLTRDISAAMNEALDQDATVAAPKLRGRLPHITFAQETLARRSGSASVLSTPLYDASRPVGALTLERDSANGFDNESQKTCELLGALLGPVIALKREKDRHIGSKILTSLQNARTQLFGPNHVMVKLYSLILLATLLFFSVATGDYRITSPARLEGSVKRVVTAPRDGFVAVAPLRAGDIVQSGDLLASLDDQALQLEQLKLQSQHEQLNKEHRAAMSKHDRSTTAIVNARRKQTDAQLALIEEQLSRSRLTAPLDGIVVSGDLSQNIGSPVENGQVLFEVAPLDEYRVVLEIDERDIGDIAHAQQGVLTLTGLPETTLPFTVTRIVPLSTTLDGRNFFEVHAELETPTPALRPGMEGVGKTMIDERKLIWIWTHNMIDWLRLSLWTWIN